LNANDCMKLMDILQHLISTKRKHFEIDSSNSISKPTQESIKKIQMVLTQKLTISIQQQTMKK